MDSAEAAFEHAVISYFELAGSESLTSHSAEKLLVAVGCPPGQVAAAELEASAGARLDREAFAKLAQAAMGDRSLEEYTASIEIEIEITKQVAAGPAAVPDTNKVGILRMK
jgi:hypothetical protein